MLRSICCCFLVLLFGGVSLAQAQSTVTTVSDVDEEASVHYVVKRQATLYRQPSTGQPYLELGFREPLQVLETSDGWHHVKTSDGVDGYVPESALSNVWLRVSKQKKTVFLYEGTSLVRQFPADFGYNAFADKERRGSMTNPDDWRTPEGVFFVVRKNPNSTFYKALVLNYPTAEDAARGRQQGLISETEYRAIVDAEQRFDMPPMHTALGGWIEIHGDGTGVSTNWTQGCVAVHNDHIDELWEWVHVGTPVLVER